MSLLILWAILFLAQAWLITVHCTSFLVQKGVLSCPSINHFDFLPKPFSALREFQYRNSMHCQILRICNRILKLSPCSPRNPKSAWLLFMPLKEQKCTSTCNICERNTIKPSGSLPCGLFTSGKQLYQTFNYLLFEPVSTMGQRATL